MFDNKGQMDNDHHKKCNGVNWADWLSESHSLSEATNLLSKCKTLEDVKLESNAQSARPARTLSLLALSVPRLA
ncbi:hypothetical protein glysoja_028200 [Glycine soja]|uniref:Uncharacterized protein n=1 Tax=Glycine soja TaxID=3848 RepID=A0A0B2QW96_GLYSO|nr:hypothetical protein glysoja_028200 [Glycine soja]